VSSSSEPSTRPPANRVPPYPITTVSASSVRAASNTSSIPRCERIVFVSIGTSNAAASAVASDSSISED